MILSGLVFEPTPTRVDCNLSAACRALGNPDPTYLKDEFLYCHVIRNRPIALFTVNFSHLYHNIILYVSEAIS